MPVGNGPIATTPVYATDETVAIRATGDYITLAPAWQLLAYGTDGVFATNAQWVMNSASNTFDLQGVTAQNVIYLEGPASYFKGAGQLFAIDSALGNAVTLRRIGEPLNIGWPPGPATGVTGVTFKVLTLAPQIEEATWVIKDRFMIDEAVLFRSSGYMYAGVEDYYRQMRRATVLSVLYDRYVAEARVERGDFEMKRMIVQEELKAVLMRIQIKWGCFGNSAEPAMLMGTKLSR